MGYLFDIFQKFQDRKEQKVKARMGKLIWQEDERRDYAQYAGNETILRHGWKGDIRQGKEKT